MASTSDSPSPKDAPNAPLIAPNRRGSVFGLSFEPARFEVERPVHVTPPTSLFGSDLVVETLRELDIPFVAMTADPALGELNDSLVNYLGNTRPQLLSCLDEETALDIALGYARVSGRPMAVALGSTTQVTPGTPLAVAQREALPLMVLQSGATPGEPAAHHLLADFAPEGPAEARYAILQANRMAQALPQGPVRVTLTPEVQRASVEPLNPRRNPHRYRARVTNGVSRGDVAELASMLLEAERPVILAGRVSRSATGWQNRIILAELLGAQVHTAPWAPAAFPTDHPLFMADFASDALWRSDVLLSLGWHDLAGLTRGSYRERNPNATIIEVSPDVSRKLVHGDEGSTPTPSDILLEADVDQVIAALIEELGDISSSHQTVKDIATPAPDAQHDDGQRLARADVSRSLASEAGRRNLCIATVPAGWPTAPVTVRGPLDYLGAGQGTPAQAIGSALALVGTDRIAVGVLRAADFIPGASALWTAAHYRIPLLLVVVSEDGSDTQRRISQSRGRTADNAWIGHQFSQPNVNLRALAEAFGVLGLDAGASYKSLTDAVAQGVEHAGNGGVAVVEVRLS